MKSIFASLLVLASVADQPLRAETKVSSPEPQVELESQFIAMPAATAEKLGWIHAHAERENSRPSVFSPAEWSKVAESMAASKQIAVLAAPKATTQSGRRVVIEIIREFRFPVAFSVRKDAPDHLVPDEFETRNIGVTLEAEPRRGDDGMLELSLVGEVTAFKGFQIYDGGKTASEATKAKSHAWFQTPLIDTIRTQSMVSMKFGQTLLLGGFPRPTSKTIEQILDISGTNPSSTNGVSDADLVYVTITAKEVKASWRPGIAAGSPVEVSSQILRVARADLARASLAESKDLGKGVIATAEGAPVPRIAAVFIPESLAKFLDILKSGPETQLLSGPTHTIAKDESYDVKAEDFTPSNPDRLPRDKKPEDASTNEKGAFPPFDLTVKPSTAGTSTIDLEIVPKMRASAQGESKRRSVSTSLSMYENQTAMMAVPDPAKKDDFLLLFITAKGAP